MYKIVVTYETETSTQSYDYIDKFIAADKITIVACGTSWHAGLIAEYMFEKIAKIAVEVEYASEFRYRNPKILMID